MKQVEVIVSSGWRDAEVVSCASGCRVEDLGEGRFQLLAGASIGEHQRNAVDDLQDKLSAYSGPAAAHMIHDGLVLGNGFMVYSPEGLLRETDAS